MKGLKKYGGSAKKVIKSSHRGTGSANIVPRSATFSSKKPQIQEHHTFSSKSKAKHT